MKLAPVVIFVYARPEHTAKTIESLAKNVWADETDVYIFSDAAKNERTQEPVSCRGRTSAAQQNPKLNSAHR